MRTIAEFAAKRRGDQEELEKTLYPHVAQALQAYPVEGWYNDLLAEVARQYLAVYHAEGGTGQPVPPATAFTADVRATLDKTENPTDATTDRVSTWLATAILNAGTSAATADDEEFLLLEWVTMNDQAVRDAHAATEGQQRPPGDAFDVAGTPMRYPGDPTAPIELWINCRCALAPTLPDAETFARTEGVTTMSQTAADDETLPAPLAWHGVLAPEGVWSGDGRQFAPDSLRFRDLPLPLTWQKATDAGHDGSVVVGKIEAIERVDGMMSASGTFLQVPEADEVVGLLAEFGRFGVSVDADDAEFEFSEADDRVTFTSARIASASIVSIPAFAEAFIALGPGEAAAVDDDMCDPESENYDPELCDERHGKGYAVSPHTFVSDKPWSDFTQADYTPEQWKSACCLHRSQELEPKSNHGLPIKEPGGALNRNGVHAAAGRFNQTSGPAEAKAAAKSCLRGAYRQIGEEPPDVLKARVEPVTFDRGPGWITHPADTKRIHDYWTRPGEEGYAKIGWGKGGDFARCKALVGEKIAENSPEDVRFLNEICARWHHDALGIWPGEHRAAAETIGGSTAPSVSLVAAATSAPAAWFADPRLPGPTHLSVTDDGRVYGHLAEWSACHIGFEDVCVAPPHSETDYAYYATGSVRLDDGTFARTGVISLGGGHARDGLGVSSVLAHYDSTSTAVADVCIGEDEHGIWCAGWVRPGVTDEQVYALRASDVSGDWRDVRGNLELVAALAVNVGGFPTVSVGVENGVQVSLVAAGHLPVETVSPNTDQETEKWADILSLAMAQVAQRREKMRALAARVRKE